MSAGSVEVFGRYLVYEQLGMGGMARVDRAALADAEGAPRPVALKRMLPHVATNDDMVKAFVREARLASHLRHVNVAQTYECGKIDGVHFIAMELVTGPTLREILRHCAYTTGPMPIQIALNILNQICDALDYAHNLRDETGQPLGIIHRDVSPANIIVDEAGVTKLIDFGVAKASAAGMQTTSGMIKGKFGYMAPEYLVGSIDARADLFALGIIAHELLTNRPLFSVADDIETMRRMRTMPLQPPSHKNPNVPAEIDGIVMTALSRDPDCRWQHATALRAALTTLTKRLGLVCTNRQVVEWISWAFEQKQPLDPEGAAGAASAHEAEPGEPSVVIELDDPPQPPPRMPLGAPARAITTPPPPDDSRTLVDPPGPSPAPRAKSIRPLPDGLRTLVDPPGSRSAVHRSLSPGEDRDATLIDSRATLVGRATAPGPSRPRGVPAPLLATMAAIPPPPRPPSVPPPAPATTRPPTPSPIQPPSSPPIRPPSSPPIPGPATLLLPQLLLPQPLLPQRRDATASVAPLTDAAREHHRRGHAIAVVVRVLLAAGLATAGAYLALSHLV